MKKRIGVLLAAFFGSLLLTACITPYEGVPSTCEGNGPSDPSWPYCGSAQPGGSQPSDWPDL